MLEKLFGRKTTGVVNIICTSLILLAAVDYVVMYFLGYTSPLDLIGYAFFCATALAILLLPRLLQKKFKLYIPTFVEILLSLFVVAYLLTDLFYEGRTMIFTRFMPGFGGAVIAMTAFSVFYSIMEHRARKKGKKVSAFLVTLTTFAVSGLAALLWHIIQYLVAILIFKHDPTEIMSFIVTSSFYYIGIGVFCVICFIQTKMNTADRYRIKSFKDTGKAKQQALDTGDTGFYKVISNNERDDINYKGLFLSAKSKFLLGKIVYYALYAGYLVSLIVGYYKERLLNLVLIISLVSAFAVSLGVSLYEYRLFKKNTVTSRLFKLKALKSGLRMVSLGLTFAMLFQSDLVYNDLTVLTSIAMVIVNIITFINNLRKDNRYSSVESYSRNTLKNGKRSFAVEAAEDQRIVSQPDEDALPEL